MIGDTDSMDTLPDKEEDTELQQSFPNMEDDSTVDISKAQLEINIDTTSTNDDTLKVLEEASMLSVNQNQENTLQEGHTSPEEENQSDMNAKHDLDSNDIKTNGMSLAMEEEQKEQFVSITDLGAFETEHSSSNSKVSILEMEQHKGVVGQSMEDKKKESKEMDSSDGSQIEFSLDKENNKVKKDIPLASSKSTFCEENIKKSTEEHIQTEYLFVNKISATNSTSMSDEKETKVSQTEETSTAFLESHTVEHLSSFHSHGVLFHSTDFSEKMTASAQESDDNNVSEKHPCHADDESIVLASSQDNADYDSIQQVTEKRFSQENQTSSQASDISDKEIPASTPRSDVTVSPSPLDSGLISSGVQFDWSENSESLVTNTVDIMTQSIYLSSTAENKDADESLELLIPEESNDQSLKNPLLQMTETVLFIAASGKESSKLPEQQNLNMTAVKENRSATIENKGGEAASTDDNETSTSTKPPIVDDSIKKPGEQSDADANQKQDDPIATWGEPLGLPSPIRPSTPAKQPRKGDEEQMDTNKVGGYLLMPLVTFWFYIHFFSLTFS
jgi:hypothetical protein